MAQSKKRHARGEPTEQKSTREGGNLDRSVDLALFLAFTKWRDFKWSEYERDAGRRVNHHRAPSGAPFGPNETSIIWPRTLQAERDFFRYKQSKQVISRILINISTNRWYIVGWQHRHCSRLVTEEVSKTKRRHWLQIFRISIFLLCAKADFNVSLQQCRGCPHGKITSVKSTISFSQN